MALWSFEFVRLGWLRQSRFGTFSFDLGIYDQGAWLLSHGKDPFVTVRGLELFGHHVNPILFLFAPFYRLGAGPGFLLVVQVLVQASGAAAVYLLARDRFAARADGVSTAADRWLAAALGTVLLLNPTYQWLTWEFFHPDALAVAPLLFAYWAARVRPLAVVRALRGARRRVQGGRRARARGARRAGDLLGPPAPRSADRGRQHRLVRGGDAPRDPVAERHRALLRHLLREPGPHPDRRSPAT